MKGFRRSLAFVLVPLLVALLAVPAAAAPQKDKTNEDHVSWFELDPVPATTEAAEVTITGKVAGNFDMTVVSGAWSQAFVATGQFTVTVPLGPGANSIEFSGTNGNGRFINGSAIITREVDEPEEPEEPILTSLSVTLTGALTADGQSQATLTIVALHQAGRVMTSYSGPVTVTSSDASVVSVEPALVTAAGGVATFTLVAGTTVGTADLMIAADGLEPVSASVNVSPVGGAGPEKPSPSHLLLEVSGSLEADGRSEAMLYVTVINTKGEMAADYAGTLTATVSDPSVLAVGSSVEVVNGTAGFVLRAGSVPGVATVTVSASDLPDATTSVNVELPDLYLEVAVNGSLKVNDPAEATLIVRVVDAEGDVYPGFSDILTVSTSNSKVVQVGTPVLYPTSGLATGILTSGSTDGTSMITVSGAGVTASTVEVSVAPPTAPPLGLSLSLGAGQLQAYSGAEASLNILVVNLATNQVVTTYSRPLTVTSSDAASVRVVTPTVSPLAGTAIATLASGTSQHTATITVTGEGLTPASLPVTPLPPAPSHMALAYDGVLIVGKPSTATITVTVYDAANRVAATYPGPITITSSNPDAVLVENPTVTPVYGIATGTLTAGAVPGNATITVSAPGLPTEAINVTAEAPMPPHLNLVLVGTLVANNQSQATVSVTVVDADGAVDRSFSQPISFTSSNPSALQVLTPSVTPVNGVASLAVKAGSVATPVAITGTAPGLVDSALTVVPTAQVPSRLTMVTEPTSLGVGGSSQGALILNVNDQTGVRMLALTGPIEVDLISGNPSAIHFGNGAASQHVTMTTPTAEVSIYGGTLTGEATITAIAQSPVLQAETTVRAVTIRPPYKFGIDPIAPVPTGSSLLIKVRVLDAFGTQVSNSKGSGTGTVTLTRPDGSSAASWDVSFAAGLGTLTITAPAPGTYTLTATGRIGGYDLVPGQTTLIVTP